jgi:hypothetical protein
MHKLQRHEKRRHLLEDGNHLMQSDARRRQSDGTQEGTQTTLRRHSLRRHSDGSSQTAVRRQQSDGSQTAVRRQSDAQRALG